MTTQLFLNKALEVYERFGTYASNTLVPKLAEVATDILGHSMWVDAAPGLHKARIALVLPSGERLRPITVYTTLHTLSVESLLSPECVRRVSDNSVVQRVLRKTAIPGELLNRVSATFHASNECAAAYICDTARETSIDDIRNMRTGGVVVPPVVVQLLTYWRLNGDVGYVSHH